MLYLLEKDLEKYIQVVLVLGRKLLKGLIKTAVSFYQSERESKPCIKL